MYVYCIHACIKKKLSIYVIIHVAICWRMDWDQTVNNGPSKNGTGTRMDLYRWVGVSGHNRSWLCRPPPLVRLPLGTWEPLLHGQNEGHDLWGFPKSWYPKSLLSMVLGWFEGPILGNPKSISKVRKVEAKNVSDPPPKSKSHHLSIETAIGLKESHERKGHSRPFIISTKHYKSQVLLVNSKAPDLLFYREKPTFFTLKP